jgi:hypothetical protein
VRTGIGGSAHRGFRRRIGLFGGTAGFAHGASLEEAGAVSPADAT